MVRVGNRLDRGDKEGKEVRRGRRLDLEDTGQKVFYSGKTS